MESLKKKIWGSPEESFAKVYDQYSPEVIAKVIQKKGDLPKLLSCMDLAYVADSFIKMGNFIDELRDQIHTQKLEAIKHKVYPVDCLAEQLNEFGKAMNLTDQANFKADDESYSNQGPSGLCARHACGKALLEWWR